MKKTLTAGPIIWMLCGPALAQTSVTLYGVVDVNVEYVNRMASAAPVVNPNTGQATFATGGSVLRESTGGLSTNRWGLRGTEDLGAGNQAIFVLEGGFGLDDGKLQQGGRLFGRQAFVGLSNRYGQVTLGRQYTSLFQSLANFSPTAYSTQYEPISVMTGSNLRSDNTVKYTGVFGNLTGYAHWSAGNGVNGPGEVPGNFRRDAGYGAGLAYYDASGFGGTVAFDKYMPSLSSRSDTGNGEVTKAAIAGSYNVGRFKFVAGYRWGQDKYSDGSTLLRDNFYWAGINYQVDPAWAFSLGYYYDDIKNVRLQKGAPSFNIPNPWQVSFIADYSFSKRTDVYFTTAYSRNAGLNFDTPANAFSGGYFLEAGQKGMYGAALGIRHKF